ncbi:transcription factor Jun-like [Bolinopsis microptera]|uniref:transcription factor Jun-like n=1 Tax=Bolinopsis microptera TaxID=2820187 RepID=UPI00307B0CC5
MMETMSLNPEQFYKPEKKDEKPQLKLNLNLGMDDRWNSVHLSSPDLKKIAINTPELEKMAFNSLNNYSTSMPPPYSSHHDDAPVQGPTLVEEDPDQVSRGFIAALRDIHNQHDFKSETFNIPATVAGPAVSYAGENPYSKPQIPECSQSWPNFSVPVSNYNSYTQLHQPQYISSQPSYMPEQLPQYDLPESKLDSFIPDPSQIDKLNLTTAQKLNIYTQIPIHEVADPELQERLKSERKKMRNRIAASKCRKRKLQKEAELEDKVKILKKKNGDLSTQLQGLREEVKGLKVKIMSHVHAGCNIKPFSLNVTTTDSEMPPTSQRTLNSMVGVTTPVGNGALPIGHSAATTPVVSLPSMHLV